ncbi:PAS domain-containing protein [Sphingomicrobium aestuariivivum]|uniref:PAS domain-containing protein n=1 Tax=Sphingomicrobium aestuariivivum TaxID=1582356 RepID=UPI001FD6F764|nr:PAS domain-containing protein [Sphingomicrobium aestuariivivum]MCJ8191384.1 PAS domain-containing protein [Sphingomicrobium aestuariivivum]
MGEHESPSLPSGEGDAPGRDARDGLTRTHNIGRELRLLLANLPDRVDFDSVVALADALPVMIAYCDTELRYRFVNQPLADWLNRSREAMIGRRIADMMGPESYAAREPMLKKALAGENQFYAAEYSHPSKGDLVTEAEYIPHVGSDGTVLGLILIISDITGQRGAERALRESEDRFRRIADSAPVPIWVAGQDGTREFINQAYADFLGLPREAAAEIDWVDLVHPDDAQATREALVEGLKAGRAFSFCPRIRRHDGVYRYLAVQVQPRIDAEERVDGYIGTASDVTAAKEAESRLRREVADKRGELASSEMRFRAVFDTLDMVALIDLKGCYLDMNRAARSVLGEEAVLSGKKAWELPPVADHPANAAVMRKLIERAARGHEGRAEIDLDLETEYATHLLSIRPVRDEEGRPQYLVGEARDVSALKAAESQLRQSQKMEALGQLTGGIAHDFNNLLTVVLGGLDLISKRVEDEKLKRYADNALAAAQRGARLTGQLLSFSRTQKLEVRPVRIADMKREVGPLIANAMGGRYEVQWKVEDGGERILADLTQLEVALLNLAINARDAMERGGRLVVETRRVHREGGDDLPAGDYLELSVSDSGSGMAPRTLQKAFEPFFTTKEVGKGTGLGLSMVYGMVRQSGGSARIDSTLGKGTTVRLYFRLAEAEADSGDAVAAARHCAENIEGRSILVIDDDSDVRAFVSQTLEDLGAKVSRAADGAQGLDVFRKVRPDIALIDFAMPGLSGAEVAARLLERHPDQPILFMSGYSETDAIRAVAPEAPILVKPFSPDALEEALCRLLTD